MKTAHQSLQETRDFVLETLKFRRRTARHADDDTAVAAADYLANLLRGIDTRDAKFVQTADGPQIVTSSNESGNEDT